MTRHITTLLLTAVLITQSHMALADSSKEDPRMAALQAATINGPSDIPIKGQAVLHLAANETFLPAPQVNFALEANGDSVDKDFVGLIVPQAEKESWTAYVEFLPEGYIKDDDAGKLDPKALLADLTEGTEQQNEIRAEHGVPPLHIVGWAEMPAYDAAQHRLSWSVEANQEGDKPEDSVVNYNLKALGREGLISLTYITDRSRFEAEKPQANALLAHVEFNPGKRYEDFNASTDKIAAYGLAALITGVAAKKLGLLAMAGVFIAKFIKVIALAAFAGIAGLKKYFRRKDVA